MLIPVLLCAGICAGRVLKERKLPSGIRAAALIGVLALLAFYIRGNIENIRAEYPNDFHDFFAEANEAAPKYAGSCIYLGADGDFGYGNWSQNTSFLAEINGDHECVDGGVEAFAREEKPAVLVTNRDYYAQYEGILKEYKIAYENENYLYIWNGR